jgi:hypothetical protein
MSSFGLLFSAVATSSVIGTLMRRMTKVHFMEVVIIVLSNFLGFGGAIATIEKKSII